MAATRLFDLFAVFAGLRADSAGKNRKNSNGTQMPPSNSSAFEKKLCNPRAQSRKCQRAVESEHVA